MPITDYGLRVPTASSIYPRATPEETLSALLDINESLPVHKKFPVEILLLINEELHSTHAVYKEIRSIWTTIDRRFIEFWGHLDEVLFDANTKLAYISEPPSPGIYRGELAFVNSVSAADLLYRIRCFFPEAQIHSEGPDGYKGMWSTMIEHDQTGFDLTFFETKAGARMTASRETKLYDRLPSVSQSDEEDDNAFITDLLQLLNTLFGTGDGRRFMYYHPAADADYPTADEHFLAVPRPRLKPRVEEEDLLPYNCWYPVTISATDLSSFKSLLPAIKYNIEHRMVDPVNGTADLTTILSSSLLFYRLLCHYVWQQDNVNDTPPITSVWQVKLGYFTRDADFYFKRNFGPSIIFMDDRGLFDIRVEDGAEEVMDHIINLVNALFSDECCHPYDGVVAGCVA